MESGSTVLTSPVSNPVFIVEMVVEAKSRTGVRKFYRKGHGDLSLLR